LIVNGEKELVGSDNANIKHAVDNAINETPLITVHIKSDTIVDRKVQVHYTISGNISHATLNAALVQYKTITKINAGENGGATLTDYNIVRQFFSTQARESGFFQLQIPVGLDEKDLSLALFTQDDATQKITGATKKGL